MKLSFRQLNGEAMVLEVMPEVTGRELKERIKDCQLWDDELTRQTTKVDFVVGASRILKNDETAAHAGLSPESEVTVILRKNIVTCSHRQEFAQFRDEIEYPFTVQIPRSATKIRPEAFVNCYTLASVNIPDSVTLIGSGAFAGCSSLASVNIPDSVTHIGREAFEGCSSLASVTIPDSVTQIGLGAFKKCEALASVTIPNSVTKIGYGAFAGCSSLASVTIPDSVTEIGETAFQGCSALSLVVPMTQTRWEFGPFMGCKRMPKNSIVKSAHTTGLQVVGKWLKCGHPELGDPHRA